MFLKTNDERYYNFERIEAFWVNKTVDGDEFVIETVINGDIYTLETYKTEQAAKYALNFMFKLLEHTKGKRKVCRIPDENTVKLYQWADSIDEIEGAER